MTDAATSVSLSGLAGPVLGAEPAATDRRIRKAVIWQMIQENLSIEDKFRLLKDVGFDGVEVSSAARRAAGTDVRELARASQKTGLPIHGMMGASPTTLKEVIDEAAVYGATSVLYVVRDNPQGSYLQNYRQSQEVIRDALPHAEKKRVPILIENVWASFLIEALSMARYIDELKSPFMQAYFDVGNVMRWGVPQHWIEVLGKRIGKLHVKEYSLKVGMNEGMSKGFNVAMGEGDINWKRVGEEIVKIDYRGWATAEVRGGDRQRLRQILEEMQKILPL
ncbi:MAG: sugar phosphate isomerase/epimerase [Pirellulales bacterium]|nr:sugar phosphate isomerase/epimerase [Pirellulales bacterium]